MKYGNVFMQVLIALADPELHEAAKTITSAFWGLQSKSSELVRKFLTAPQVIPGLVVACGM